MTEAFPLYWPPGWRRTDPAKRVWSRFDPKGAADESKRVRAELGRLGARDVVISTNIRLRRDGLPYSGDRPPEDPGVAVYFTLDGRQQCIPCDRWPSVPENLRAIAKSVEALRGLERWGAKSFVDAAFRGFEALPAPGQAAKRPWRVVLGLEDTGVILTPDHVRNAFKELARKHHPDVGGDAATFSEIVAARDEALSELSA